MLDLFITHWTEPWEVGEKGFQMLRLQRGVDWSQVRITLVHDGTDAFPAEYFAGFPFAVNQACIPHGGIARARNWCIDHSDAEWIRWHDFDDMLYGVYALRDMLNVLNRAGKFDLLWFDMFMEDNIHMRNAMLTERNPVFIHNKLFRRSFLIDHDIRFKEDLTWCEDSAFLAIVEMEIDHQRIGKIHAKTPIYMYIARDGSLCNRPEIRFKNLQSFFTRHCYVADEFLKRGLIDPYNTMCVRIMADSYYTLRRAPGITEDKSEHEARVWAWFDKHRDAFYACRPEMINDVMRAVNNEDFDGGFISYQNVIQWIQEHERSVA